MEALVDDGLARHIGVSNFSLRQVSGRPLAAQRSWGSAVPAAPALLAPCTVAAVLGSSGSSARLCSPLLADVFGV